MPRQFLWPERMALVVDFHQSHWDKPGRDRISPVYFQPPGQTTESSSVSAPFNQHSYNSSPPPLANELRPPVDETIVPDPDACSPKDHGPIGLGITLPEHDNGSQQPSVQATASSNVPALVSEHFYNPPVPLANEGRPPIDETFVPPPTEHVRLYEAARTQSGVIRSL